MKCGSSQCDPDHVGSISSRLSNNDFYCFHGLEYRYVEVAADETEPNLLADRGVQNVSRQILRSDEA